jgi:hypothetical protein
VSEKACAKHDQQTGGDEDYARELTREVCRRMGDSD